MFSLILLATIISNPQCQGNTKDQKQVQEFINKNSTKFLGNLSEPFKSYTELQVKDVLFTEEGNTAIVVCDVNVIYKTMATFFVVLNKFNGNYMIIGFSIRDNGLLKYIKDR